VLKALSDADPERKSAAIWALYCHAWPEATDARLLKLGAKGQPVAVRAAVMECIPERGELTPKLWGLLQAGLVAADERTRTSALSALEVLGGRVQPFHHGLHDTYAACRDEDVRVTILNALANCRLDAKDAAPLKKILAGPASVEQLAALAAALALPPKTPGLLDAAIGDPKPVVRQLIAELRGEDAEKRVPACVALVSLQEFAAEAVPVFHEMLRRDPGNGLYYAGAILELTGQRVRGAAWSFQGPPGGYPWPAADVDPK
jgi:hypothetical protein